MARTSSPSTARAARRLFPSAFAVAASSAILALAGSCESVTGTADGLATSSATTNAGNSTGAAGLGAPVGSNETSGDPGLNGVPLTPGAAVAPGGAAGPGGAVAPGVSPGGAVSPGGVMGTGGAGPGGAVTPGGTSGPAGPGTPVGEPGSGGMSSQADACVDVEPPPDPERPDATCANWATETDECTAEWFADYCDLSCGRCVPEGGGVTPNEPQPEPEACEDIEPPPDPEWPDATCRGWAAETDECAAEWFADYCDISCGRCVPEGGVTPVDPVVDPGPQPEPEPETCEDIEPPPDPEWPDATCESWALEADECNAEWFADYCDISCGRCVPEGGLPPQPMAPDCSGEGLPNVSGGDGFASRYWDCCQPHCAQFSGHRCSQDGVSGSGDMNSACSGGGSFACYDEAPRAVSECLSYGNIAKSNPNCGECYRIQFTGQGEHNANDPGSRLIAGKQMIVKVTNTGGDVAGNQFDLMVPGGGVGQFDACSRQWGTSDLGAQYGGFLTECSGTHSEKKECVRQECMKIPAGSGREGCLWFVDWFQVADNPRFTSEPTSCPF